MYVNLAMEDLMEALEENVDELRTADLIKLCRVIKEKLVADGKRLSSKGRKMLEHELKTTLTFLNPED